MKKTLYLTPAVEVLSLEMMKETLQTGSYNTGGENLGDAVIPGGDWTDWFNNVL